MLATGSLLSAALLPLLLLLLIALTATDAAGTLEKNVLELLLLLVQLTLQKGGFRQGNPMLLRGDSDCCCCAHKDTALRMGKHHGPEGRTESKIYVSRGRNVPFEISYKKLAIRFSRLAAGSLLAAALLPLCLLLLRLLVSAAAYWCLLLPAAACCCLRLPAACCWCCCWWLLLLSCCCNQTASKARNNCCCCCAHKDTALPDEETPWPWRTNGVQNMRFPRPERPFWNLLEKACYTFLDAGYWLAASCCTAAVARTATDCSYCWRCWNPRKKIYWSCWCAHKDTALPDGEHHGPEGRTESKICVSRGRNVPSEISYKQLAIRFSMLATGSLLAAALLPLLLLLLMLLEP